MKNTDRIIQETTITSNNGNGENGNENGEDKIESATIDDEKGRNGIDATPICIPCGADAKDQHQQKEEDLLLANEARIIAYEILHRCPSLPCDFKFKSNNSKEENGKQKEEEEKQEAGDEEDEGDATQKPSARTTSNSSSSSSSPMIVYKDILQTPCPFITPSLLCSNQNPFIVLEELLSEHSESSRSSPLSAISNCNNSNYIGLGQNDPHSSNSNSEQSTPITTPLTPTPATPTSKTLNQYEFHIPSIVGTSTYIDTSIHLLHSIQYIEMDYFDHNDVSFDSFYNALHLSSSNNANSHNNNHNNGRNGAGFNIFHTLQQQQQQPGRSRFFYHPSQNNEMNSVLTSNMIMILSRVYGMDLSVHTSSGNNREDGEDLFGNDGTNPDSNYRFGSASLPILQQRPLLRRPNSSLAHLNRRRIGGFTLTQQQHNNSITYSDNYNNTIMSTTRARNYRLLDRRIRRAQQYYDNYPTDTDNHNDNPLHRRNHHRQFHHSISQALDEDDSETFHTLDTQHRRQKHSRTKGREEEEKEFIHVMCEERHETIAQLTQLILDELPSSSSSTNAITTTEKTASSNSSVNSTPYQKYKPTSNAQKYLFSKYNHIPKRVCQHPFKKNDIVWLCRTCQADETCVLCHYCYTHSDHVGHDVAFYHAQAGGCCDCGDEDAWNPNGFCGLHGRKVATSHGGDITSVLLEKHVELKVRGVLKSCVEYIRLFACGVEVGYERANGGKILIEGGYDGDEDDEENNNGNIGTGMKLLFRERRRSSLSGLKRKSDDSDDNSNNAIEFDDAMSNDQSHDVDMTLNGNEIFDAEEQSGVSFLSFNDPTAPMDVDASPRTPVTKAANNDEFKFDPTAASTSKSRSSPSNHLKDAIEEMMDVDSEKSGADTSHHSQYQKFNPEYASMSKSRAQILRKDSPNQTEQKPISPHLSRAHQLGLLGLQQDGLYLILHADDVHENKLISTAIKELYLSCSIANSSSFLPHEDDIFSPSSINLESVTNFIPSLFRKKDGPMGDLIVWGPFELMEELGPVLSQCWKDGDATACSRFGALMLDKAKILQEKGLVVSIKTRVELCREVRALAVLEFLKMMSDCCDPFCHLVSLALGGSLDTDPSSSSLGESPTEQSGCLLKMMKNDLKLPQMLSGKWRDLLLKLLSEPNFKAALSNAYTNAYSDVTREYAHGVGILDKSSFILSVQFLNRVTYVQDLVLKKDFLGCVMRSLLNILSVAKATSETSPRTFGNDRLNILHPVVIDRRYSPCISDLKCVLNVPGIARLFASMPQLVPATSPHPFFNGKNCVDAWVETLSLAQNMDIQVWRSEIEGHVEMETKSWIAAFNASISLGSLFERLLMWKDDDELPGNFENCPLTLLNINELTQYLLLNGVAMWQKNESNMMNSLQRDGDGEMKSNYPLFTPMSNISVAQGCADKMNVLTLTQKSSWSFHLPLHRFLASCLREVVRRPSALQTGENRIAELLTNLQSSSVNVLQLVELFNGLIEFPLIILSRAAQIRSKLWRRNGHSMIDQVMNYSEPSFCKSLRDADLLVMQFGVIGNIFLSRESSFSHIPDGATKVLGCANFVCLLLQRFGIFDFVGLHAFSKESKILLNAADKTNPAANDPDRLSSMLEEFLFLLIIFVTELPPPQCFDRSKHIELARQRLRREVVHRLASGSKTHSDLSEVHHVLPLQDYVALSEEGMFVNPEDTTGAALEAILVEVADCKSILGKSDKWQLQKWAWNEYDPAFFHSSVQSHQNAAENRPKGMGASKEKGKIDSFPYAPFPPTAHDSFSRLRKDISADANVIAIIYRVLHIHCRKNLDNKAFSTDIAYDRKALSETLVGRVLHILTLGVYAWDISSDVGTASVLESVDMELGSIFATHSGVPNQEDWVERVFLSNPEEIMMSNDYTKEETMIELVDKLSREGGAKHFRVEDEAIRAGAAWLCESVVRISPKAAVIIGRQSKDETNSGESDFQRRKREAKERQMKEMHEKMANFAKHFEKDNFVNSEGESAELNASSGGSLNLVSNADDHLPTLDLVGMTEHNTGDKELQDSMKCAICGNGKQVGSQHGFNEASDNVLAICGFVQPSLVLKGGCSVTSNQEDTFVSNHISLCGHAVHTSCCESHVTDMANRGGRHSDSLERGKRPEFRCPVCRRLSNCLVPSININTNWVKTPESSSLKPKKNKDLSKDDKNRKHSLNDFLSKSRWWASRNVQGLKWNGRCSFIPENMKQPGTTGESIENNSNEAKTFSKKDLLKVWSSAMSVPSFMRKDSEVFSNDPESIDDCSFVSPAVAEVWKRLLDHISDTCYRADIKRLGEERLFSNFGEFRHYLVEKTVFNEANRLAGIGTYSWPSCIPNSSINLHPEFSKEKLLSKLFRLTETLTYSCCSEEADFVRQVAADSKKNIKKLMVTFGVAHVKCDGQLLILSNSFSEGNHNEIFYGRIGRLRYFALCTMIAISALSLEVVQLSLDFPTLHESDSSQAQPRAPIVYPLLCGHVLVRVTAALSALCGQEVLNGRKDDNHKAVDTLDECKSMIQIGYIARVLQVSLGFIQQNHHCSGLDWSIWEMSVSHTISMMLEPNALPRQLKPWELTCCKLILTALTGNASKQETVRKSSTTLRVDSAVVLKAFEMAKDQGSKYVIYVSLIFQVIMPTASSIFSKVDSKCKKNDLLETLDISLDTMMRSNLVCQLVRQWYVSARPRLHTSELVEHLDCKREFKTFDWPLEVENLKSMYLQGNLPLFQGTFKSANRKPRVMSLPHSYTDLYSEVVVLKPNCDSAAVCLVCGEVMNAEGKGECTKHSAECGDGCGIFFLVQKCTTISIHKDKAAFVMSPYVDSHGEVPAYRGRPLFLDTSRYYSLHELWSSHQTREKVVSERFNSAIYDLIDNNFY